MEAAGLAETVAAAQVGADSGLRGGGGDRICW